MKKGDIPTKNDVVLIDPWVSEASEVATQNACQQKFCSDPCQDFYIVRFKESFITSAHRRGDDENIRARDGGSRLVLWNAANNASYRSKVWQLCSEMIGL